MKQDNIEKKRRPHFITIIACCIFALFLIYLIVWFVWGNIPLQPIHIGEVTQVESVTVSYSCPEHGDTSSFELNITEQEALQEFINTVENLKGHNIVNGGSGDYDTTIHISVQYHTDYSGEMLGYCLLYGPQILLSEGGGIGYSYEMSDEDYQTFLNYLMELHESDMMKLSESIRFSSHPALAQTERVGGMIPYNIQSDDIIEIPEEYFDELDGMSYDEIVKKIGKPNGTVGSGIVRDYWRIGEDKYAVWWYGFEIWNGTDK